MDEEDSYAEQESERTDQEKDLADQYLCPSTAARIGKPNMMALQESTASRHLRGIYEIDDPDADEQRN